METSQLWREPSSGDVTIHVKDQTFYVNRKILCMWSNVFSKMLSSQMKESVDNIKLPNENPLDFEVLLAKLHPPCNRVSSSNIQMMMYYADLYDVPCLMEECVAFIQDILPPKSIDDVVMFLELALKYRLDSVKTSCLSWIAEHVTVIDQFVPLLKFVDSDTLLELLVTISNVSKREFAKQANQLTNIKVDLCELGKDIGCRCHTCHKVLTNYFQRIHDRKLLEPNMFGVNTQPNSPGLIPIYANPPKRLFYDDDAFDIGSIQHDD